MTHELPPIICLAGVAILVRLNLFMYQTLSPRRNRLGLLLGLILLPLALSALAAQEPTVVLENPALRIELSKNGQITRLLAKASQEDILDHNQPARLLHFTLGNQLIEPTSVTRSNHQLDFTFDQSGLVASLSIDERPEAIILQLINIQCTGAGYERIYFFGCHSTLGIEANDPFAIGVFPLTLGIKADVPQGLNRKLGVEGVGNARLRITPITQGEPFGEVKR